MTSIVHFIPVTSVFVESNMSPREIDELKSIRMKRCLIENKTLSGLSRSHISLDTSGRVVSCRLHTGCGSVVWRDVVVFVDIDLDAAVAAGRDTAALGAAERDGDDAVDVGEQDGHADRHHEARYDGRN